MGADFGRDRSQEEIEHAKAAVDDCNLRNPDRRQRPWLYKGRRGRRGCRPRGGASCGGRCGGGLRYWASPSNGEGKEIGAKRWAIASQLWEHNRRCSVALMCGESDDRRGSNLVCGQSNPAGQDGQFRVLAFDE
jgi:hypothetical protein